MIAAWRRLPWGLLGTLALVATIERTVARHSLEISRSENLDWRSAGRSARQRTVGRDFLVFGTSMTQQSLLPIVLRERTGGAAYNLSICAGQAPAAYFLLKRALDSGATPKAVFVDFHPEYLSGSYRTAMAFWPDLLEPAECLDLAWTARDAPFFASTALARSLPSVGDRLQIRSAIAAALGGEASPARHRNLMFIHNKNQNLGALLYPKQPAYRGDVAPAYVRAFLPDSWTVDPINARYVRRFVALAKSRGVTVYWMIPPLSPELQNQREEAGLDEPYNRFIQSIQAVHSNLVVLDARKSGYGAEVFIDAAHLDGQGACALSSAVGDVVASLRDGQAMRGTWIMLPPYRDRQSATPLVDLHDSEVALRTLFNRTK